MRIDRVFDADTPSPGAELFDSPPVPEFVSRSLASPDHHLLYAWDDSDRAIGFVSGMELTHPDKGIEMYMDESAWLKMRAIVVSLRAWLRRSLPCPKSPAAMACGENPNPTISEHSRPYRRVNASGEDPGVVFSWQFEGRGRMVKGMGDGYTDRDPGSPQGNRGARRSAA